MLALWKRATEVPDAAIWVYGSWQITDNDGAVLDEFRPGLSGNILAPLVAGEGLPLQASLVKAKDFHAVGGFDPLLCGVEDRDVGRRLALRGEANWTPAVVARIRVGQVGSTTDWGRLAEDDRRGREKVLATDGVVRTTARIGPIRARQRPGVPRVRGVHALEPEAPPRDAGPGQGRCRAGVRAVAPRAARFLARHPDSHLMRVGIDARFLTHPQLGGFKTYTEELVAALARVDAVNDYVLYLDRPPDERTKLPRAFNFAYRVVPASCRCSERPCASRSAPWGRCGARQAARPPRAVPHRAAAPAVSPRADPARHDLAGTGPVR